MSGLISLTGFLSIIFLGGYLYCEPLLPSRLIKSRLGGSILVGNILFVLIYRFLHAQGLWISAFSVCMLGGLAYSAARIIYKKQDQDIISQHFQKTDIFLLFGLGILYLLQVWHTVGYDDIVHFHFASQIIRGKFPPSFHAFTQIPAKYHYGWATLVAAISMVGHTNLPISSDILTLYSLTGCILLALSLFELLGCSHKAKIIGTIIFFLGGGFFLIGHLLLYGSIRNGLCTLSMFQQHPTVFGISIFLFVINLIAFYSRNPKQIKWCLLPMITLPAIAIPVINATSGPFVIFTILFIGLISIFHVKRNSTKLVIGLGLVIIMSLLYFTWKLMGGFMIFGDFYDNPSIGLSIKVLGLSSYVKYMTAYFVLLAPVGTIVLFVSILYILKRGRNFIHENIAIILLLIVCIFLFPLPSLFLIKNAAIWDSFCKVNYFGVLAGWILLVYLADKTGILNRNKKIETLVLSIFLILICHESVITMSMALKSDAYKTYMIGLKNKQNLIEVIKRDVPIDSDILLINKEQRVFYEVSKETNRLITNYYAFCNKYYNDFIIVPQETGASMPNLYMSNYNISRTMEYQLFDNLKDLLYGNGLALKKSSVKFILCMIDKCPQYLDQWKSDGLIEPFRENQNEGWVLYKVASLS